MVRRNTHFDSSRVPLGYDPTLRLQESRISGPVSFLNPTQARFTSIPASTAGQKSNVVDADTEKAGEATLPPNVEYKYTTRNNRKGRHALIVRPTSSKDDRLSVPPASSSPKSIRRGIWRMLTVYPVWDVSWLVAVTFTLGSVIWVLNSFFVFLPLDQPMSEFNGEVLYGGGITAFIGATVFEIGSIFLLLEAVNENRAGCFGWAIERLYDDHTEQDTEVCATTKISPATDNCSHHHQNTLNVISKPAEFSSRQRYERKGDPTPQGTKLWTWWPSASELRNHYIHDLGFWACLIQFAAASVFWISGFTALPGIFNKMSPGLMDGIYWTPQVIGGAGFVVSGLLFMIETQKRWWMPAPSILGWWIGLWNFIGGVGFLLCPCFGFSPAHWTQYQAGLTTLWGSWAFLIGSVLQWYESLQKHPVETEKPHRS